MDRPLKSAPQLHPLPTPQSALLPRVAQRPTSSEGSRSRLSVRSDRSGAAAAAESESVDLDADGQAAVSDDELTEIVRKRHAEMFFKPVDWDGPVHRFRVATLPFRVTGTILKKQLSLGPRKRPTWSRGFEVTISTMRSVLKNGPRNPKYNQKFTDLGIVYQAFLPKGVLRWKGAVDVAALRGDAVKALADSVGHDLKIQVAWPEAYTPELAKSCHLGTSKVPRSIDLFSNPNFLKKLSADPGIPIVLHLHGGAFALCRPGLYRGLYYHLITHAPDPTRQPIIVSLEYERPPVASIQMVTQECLLAYAWLSHLVGPKKRVSLFGDSAGGNLCIGTCLALQRLSHTYPDPKQALLAGLPRKPASVVAISPWVDLSESAEDLIMNSDNARYDYLPPEAIPYYARLAARGLPLDHPEASPYHAKADELQAALPRGRTFVVYSELEILRGQIERFIQKFESGFLSAQMYGDQVHCFVMLIHLNPKPPNAEKCAADISEFFAAYKGKEGEAFRVLSEGPTSPSTAQKEDSRSGNEVVDKYPESQPRLSDVAQI